MTWDEIVALYKAHARPAASMSYLLIHSMAHHVMHGIARFSGLDLGSLREVIFPADLAFVVHRARHDGRPRKYLVHVARPKRSVSPLPKLVVADDTLAYVGSANLLSSSEELSLETGLLIEGGDSPPRVYGRTLPMAAAAQVARLVDGVLRVARSL